MTKYVALLRGINVGGKTVKMDRLATVMDGLGFMDVKTILASGNVVFTDHSGDSVPRLILKIEQAIKLEFGFNVDLQVRPLEQIAQIVEANPFANLAANKDTHWYVTFLNGSHTSDDLPIPPAEAGFTFIGLNPEWNALFSVIDRTAVQTTDFMTFLDKQFGKEVTTRNWNTVIKIASFKS